MENIWFTSFADSRLKPALRRIRKQALLFGFSQDHTLVLSEKQLDPAFREQMHDRLIPGSRGFGFWCWKPQVILQALDKMPDGALLIYADAGCHLNERGKKRLEEYLAIVRKQKLLSFHLDGFSIAAWTKGDLLDYFKVRGKSQITAANQTAATVILLEKCEKTVQFFKKFLEITMEHPNLIDDSPSLSPNLNEFREHRHDQSVYSLMYELSELKSLPGNEIDANNPSVPIQAKRDKLFGWRKYAIPPLWWLFQLFFPNCPSVKDALKRIGLKKC